jgi:hypothetical protein
VSFNEFHFDALEKRNLALNQKKFAIKLKQDAVVLRDKINAILFGDTDNYGIVSVIQQYYKLLRLGNGVSTSKPSFADLQTAKNQFINEFALSVTVLGDGAGGIYPPDPQTPSTGTEKPDPDSVWLTNFEAESSPSATGIAQRIDELLTAVGIEASQDSDYRGSYTSAVLAQQAIAAQKGSGILGIRTENSELNTNTIGIETAYSIGRGGLDTPDSFSMKTQLLNALSNVISALDAWKNQSEIILKTLNGAKAEIITEYKIDLPFNDRNAVSASIDQAAYFIQTVQEFITYFSGFSNTTSANRAAFNTKLNELKDYVGTVLNGISDRCNDIPALMGDASAGLKKHLVFWVKEATRKSDGPYALLSAADNMITNSGKKMQEQDERLNFFDQDKTRWILAPNLTLIYDDHILDLDKTVKEKRITLIWEPVVSANKYRILIRPFNEAKINLTNDLWLNAEEHWITAKVPETGLLRNTFTLPAPGIPVIARMIAYDSNEGTAGDFDRMDGFDTRSPQTDIVSDGIPFAQLKDISGATVLSVNKAEKLREQQLVWLNNSILAAVFSISEDVIQLDRNYGVVESVKKIFGLYVPAGYSEPELEDN